MASNHLANETVSAIFSIRRRNRIHLTGTLRVNSAILSIYMTMQLHYPRIVLCNPTVEEIVMKTLTEEFSKLTDRYQTTVPSGVRKLLNLGKGDRIRYRTEPSGRVYIEPERTPECDPALGAFLDLIETDIKEHPERIQMLDGRLCGRLQALVGNVTVDLDEQLSPDNE